MTEHMGLLGCSVEAAAAWANLFLASLFFLCHITFPNSHTVSRVCHWHGRVDSCYMIARQMYPCLLAVLLLVTHIVFLKESKRTLRTKNFFWHFGRLLLSHDKNHQNNTFCGRGHTCFLRLIPME